jgi:hypothetical protein
MPRIACAAAGRRQSPGVAPVRRALRQALAAMRSTFELRDVFVFGGLAGAVYGIAQVYPPAAWIAGGAALFWLGIRRV